ncbi:hypothetical protein BROUX41_004698 [Berkeleyomyces rouxiae]|uniref:uncharacterized protein n=1 Tax=Berkeleyomyces rouxiae TaxID=2035830 RepID=UPI003B784889
MSSTEDDILALQKGLEPYIKQRDEAAYIRRTLALYLQDAIDGPELESPISLVDESSRVDIPSDMKGLRREYLQALEENLKATASFQEIRSHISTSTATETKGLSNEMDAVNDQITLIRMKQKEKKLRVVAEYLDRLNEKPAADPDFLDPEQIFDRIVPLPEIPEEVVTGIVETDDASGHESTESQETLVGIDKQILKTKLLLKQEEKLLEAARALLPPNSERITETRKRYALNVTRNELIRWIETELLKASQETAAIETAHSPGAQTTVTVEDITALTEHIKDKYAKYISHRQGIAETVGKVPKLDSQPTATLFSTKQPEASAPAVKTMDYLMSPYLEKLFALSHEQRALASHKAHISATLAKQEQESRQKLDHLAEESQLLNSYNMDRSNGGLEEDTGDASFRIAEWSCSAEAAKLNSLEIVAEKMETGQIALEASQAALTEVGSLSNQQPDEDSHKFGHNNEADTANVYSRPEKHPECAVAGDVWERIHGKLGLIGQEM